MAEWQYLPVKQLCQYECLQMEEYQEIAALSSGDYIQDIVPHYIMMLLPIQVDKKIVKK